MKPLLTTRVWSLALTIGLALGLGRVVVAQAQAQAQPTDPASVMIAYAKAFPSETALELFSDNAVVRIIPALPNTSGVWTGKEQIRQLLQFARGQNASMEIIGSPQVDGNRVTASTRNHSDLFRGLGVSPVEHTYEVVVEDGKINSLVAAMTPAEQQRVAAARQAQSGQSVQPPAGMPRTGSPLVLPLIMVGMLLLATGGLLGRRKA